MSNIPKKNNISVIKDFRKAEKNAKPAYLSLVVIVLTIAIFISFSKESLAANKVAAGMTHSVAVTTLGEVQCTGSNLFGECNVSSLTNIVQVAAGEYFTVALDSNGDVFCTGYMYYSPCDVSVFTPGDITYISAGPYHVVGITTAGNIEGAGLNTEGQLTFDAGVWNNLTEVSCGELHTVGLKTDNTVVCVGLNDRGQCNVSSWDTISQISAGLYYTIGLRLGTVLFTGYDNYNQSDFSSWNQGNIAYISAGYEHTVGIDNSDVPYASGQNVNGQCDVSSWDAISEVVAGPANTIGIEDDGRIVVVGNTDDGAADVEEWQILNNPPRAYTLATIEIYEDYTATTVNMIALSADYESHTITVVAGNPTSEAGSNIINVGDGTYEYYPLSHLNGSDSFTYTLTDSQTYSYTGTATVSITITPVNDAPNFYSYGDQEIVEDAGYQSVTSWVYYIHKGAYNETSQTLSLTWTCSDESLFLTAPVLSSITANNYAGLTLTYAFNEHEFGSAALTVTVSDDGGLDYLAYGAANITIHTYTLTALPVDDAPTYTNGPNLKRPNESDIVNVYPNWATDLSKGPTNESAQILTFSITENTNPGLFTIAPAIAVSGTTGTLSYTLASNTYGSATLIVTLSDDGGIANGGMDRITETFSIETYHSAHNGPGGVDDTDGSSGLVFWWDANQLPVQSDGNDITQLGDWSGYGYTITQAANWPDYSSTFSNGMPAVVFNGSSDYLAYTTALDFERNSGLGVFAVINSHTNSSYKTIISRDAGGDRGWTCQINDSSKLSFSVAESSSEGVTIVGTTSVSESLTIVSFLYDGLINDTLSVYRGDTDDSDTLSYTIPTFINGTGPVLRIGNDGDDDDFFSGAIAELIVFDRAVLSTERILIQNYLSSKYDLALSSDDKYTGDTSSAGDFDLDVAGIGKESDSMNIAAASAGIVITNSTFLQDNGDYILLGHNVETNDLTVTNLPAKVNSAWERTWMIHKTDVNSSGGNIQIAFDFDIANMENATVSTDYVLLKRTGTVGSFEILDESPTVKYNKVTFIVDTANLNTGDCLTIGSTVNYALLFNGTSQYLISETAVALAGISFTVEFWARRDTTRLMYVMGQGGDLNNLNIGFNDSDQAFFGFDNSYTVTTSSSYTDTNWHHFAFSYDDSDNSIEIYVDGEPETIDSMLGGYAGTGLLNIAKAPGSSELFEGELDEIRIWSDALSNTEIFTNMNSTLDGDESDLLYYWKLNEGIELTTLDSTINAQHQTLSPSSNPPNWVTSTLPVGYSTSAQIETNGVLNFTDTYMYMDYNYHNSANVVVTRITTDPNKNPNASSTIFNSQYWIISRIGDSSFNADLTFTTEDDIYQNNSERHKLFWRENGSTSSWKAIAYGSSISTASDTVVFSSIKTTGQFMIAMDNHTSIPASGYDLDFDGLDDYAVDETNAITLTNSSFSIEFWAKRKTTGSANMVIGHTDIAQGLSLGFTSTNAFEFSYSSSTATTGTYTDNNWHHWAVTYDSTNLTQTVYCDGVWITENTASEQYSLTGNFYVGCGPDKTNPFKGEIDDVRVWGNVRTQNDIQRYMFEPLVGDETDLIAYWRMDEPWSYSFVTDVTANSANLQVSGTMIVDDWVESIAWSERTIDEDEEYTLVAGYDLEGDTMTLSVSSGPLSATATPSTSNYSFTYSPTTNIYGTDVFEFKVSGTSNVYPITITILPINDAPELGLISDDSISLNAVASISFTVLDQETDSDNLSFTPTSDNQSLVTDANIGITCTSGSCTASITPETDESGNVQITITVADPEGLTATRAFALTVSSLPTMEVISDLTTTVNTAVTPISFTVADIETDDGALGVTITTSNSTILPLNQTVLTNSSGNCTLTLTTSAYEVGSTSIDVIVTDADGGSCTSTFVLTIIDMPGSGYMMDCSGGNYSATTSQTLNLSSHSVEAWINTGDSNWNGIVATDDSSGKWAQMSVSGTGYLAVQLMNTGGMEKAYSGTTMQINDSNWHHVAYTFDATSETLYLYVDGVLEITSVSNDQALTGFSLTEEIKIGVDVDESSYFTGKIDEVRIWDSVRTITEIRDNMCKKIPSTGMLAYYRFDQDYGTTLYDLTSNNNDCVIPETSWGLSGASIGDDSISDYVGSVSTDFSVSKAHADGDTFAFTCNTNVPNGIHLYIVNQAPNTTIDLGSNIGSDRYWGTFIIGSCTYNVTYDYTNNPYSEATLTDNELAWRDDNSDQNWDGYSSTSDSNSDGIIVSPSDNNSTGYEYILYTTP